MSEVLWQFSRPWVGWDTIKSKCYFDVDASVVMFDELNRPMDVVSFREIKSRDGSITHTGDNRTDAGEGDCEQIVVDLNAVPAGVNALVFM